MQFHFIDLNDIVKEQKLEKLRLAFFSGNFLIPSPTVTKINFRFFGITYAYNAKLSQSPFPQH